MKSNYIGNVTIIQYNRDIKPRVIPFDNNDGKGQIHYCPEPNDDGFNVLEDVPIALGKLLLGSHPDRYRLYKTERPIYAQRTNPGTGANELITIYPWSYKKESYRKDAHDTESEIVTNFTWYENRTFSDNNNVVVGEVKEVIVSPGVKQDAPVVVSAEAPEKEIDDLDDYLFDGGKGMLDKEEEKKEDPIVPEKRTGQRPRAMSKKEIIIDHKGRCEKLGISYAGLESSYRTEHCNGKRGFLNKDEFSGLWKFVEETLKKAGE